MLLVVALTSLGSIRAVAQDATPEPDAAAATPAVIDEGTPQATTPTSDYSDATRILLGETVSIEGAGATVSGSTVTITAAGTYVVSGTVEDGAIEVQAPDASVTLVLDGAAIRNSQGPAILIADAADATLTLADGSTNSVADGGASEFDAAIYSAPSLTINGEGTLHVQGNVNEGISSTMHIIMESGTVRVHAVEDGLNANANGVSEININGGYLFVETETGDGIDSNGTITVTGGTVIALGALEDMNGGFDADGGVTVNGGTVIATGARVSTPSEDSAQAAILADFGVTEPAGTLVVIQGENGEAILTFSPSIDLQQLMLSSDAITDGVTYTVFAGGTASGESVDGLYETAPTDPGTEVAQVTTDSIQEAPPGPGDRPGR